jgi:hypothetical protein
VEQKMVVLLVLNEYTWKTWKFGIQVSLRFDNADL